jgi:AcrR family transcriptional regulator
MRPRDADSEQTHGRIMEAARLLLEERGPDAVSLRGVARRAKMSVGTVSYYFSSREELVETCLDEHYQRLIAIASRHLDELAAGKGLADVIRDAARELYFFAFSDRALIRLQLITHAERGGLRPERLQGFHAKLLRTISARAGALITSPRPWLTIQALVYAVARFATASSEERRLFTSAATDHEANEVIADHIADLAVRMLSLLVF